MSTDTQSTSSEQTELKRHVGVIGLLFASVGSIIGSGWLFGALNAAVAAGPAAIISWGLGGVMILMIALVYAELGTMFPLSGGVVRFPHLAFGSFASYSAGWITWVAVSTTAPIEVEAALQYATKYAPFTAAHTVAGETVYTLTGLGYVTAVILMALFVVVNFYGVRWFARINNALVGWKIFIILLVVAAFLLTAVHGENFTSHGFMPQGWHGVFTAIATSGVVFSYLGFRQGIEFAGETDNPRRNVPIAVVGSVLITGADLRGPAGGLHRRPGPVGPREVRQLGQAHLRGRLRAARGRRDGAGPRLARRPAVRRRDHLPRRHRPDLHDHDLADLLRDGQEPQRAAGAGPHHRPRRPDDLADRDLPGRPRSCSCRSRAGSSWSASSPRPRCSPSPRARWWSAPCAAGSPTPSARSGCRVVT